MPEVGEGVVIPLSQEHTLRCHRIWCFQNQMQIPGFPQMMAWGSPPTRHSFLLPCAVIEMSLTAQEKALSLFFSPFH